jgi:two-component system alkaline phosphatase synthesis response regulator PhoP
MADKKTVLVVDDDPDFVDTMVALLRRSGYDTASAADGNDALRKARDLLPDVIVLDVMMPNKDGFKACKELKADPATSAIPILLLTAVASHVTTTKYSHRDALETEADDYLDKGCEPEEILERVRDLLEE